MKFVAGICWDTILRRAKWFLKRLQTSHSQFLRILEAAMVWIYNLWFAIKNYPVFTENDKHPTKLYILLNVFNPSCGFRGQVLNTMIHPKVPKTFGSQTTAWTHVLTANFSRSWPNVDSKAERGAFNLALWASDFQPEPPKSSEARVRKHWLPPHVGMASRNIKYKWRLFFFRTNCVYIYDYKWLFISIDCFNLDPHLFIPRHSRKSAGTLSCLFPLRYRITEAMSASVHSSNPSLSIIACQNIWQVIRVILLLFLLAWGWTKQIKNRWNLFRKQQNVIQNENSFLVQNQKCKQIDPTPNMSCNSRKPQTPSCSL